MSDSNSSRPESTMECNLCHRRVRPAEIGLRGKLNFCQACATDRSAECLVKLGAKKKVKSRLKSVMLTMAALVLVCGPTYYGTRYFLLKDQRFLKLFTVGGMVDSKPPEQSESKRAEKPVAESELSWIKRVLPGSRDSVVDVGQIHLLFVTRPGTDARLGMSSRLFITREAPSTIGARLVTEVGKEMEISFDEGLRYVRKQPRDWERDYSIRLSFEDKFVPKDGGSAGTGFTIGMLAAMRGFALDPDVAVTGDLTIDGTVQPVGAVVDKLRGAIDGKCKITLIPERNSRDVTDLALISGTSLLWETQIFSIGTIEQAVSFARHDRPAAARDAIARFAALRARLPATVTDNYLPSPIVQSELKEVLKLAPNHLSAATLLAAAENRLPHELSLNRSVEEILANSYLFISEVIAPESEKPKKRNSDEKGITVFPEREFNECGKELQRITPLLDRRALELKSACLAYAGALRGVWKYQPPDTSGRRTTQQWVALEERERRFVAQAKSQMDDSRSRILLALRKLDTDGSLMSELRKK